MKKYSPSVVKRKVRAFRILCAAGLTHRDITAALGESPATLIRWSREHAPTEADNNIDIAVRVLKKVDWTHEKQQCPKLSSGDDATLENYRKRAVHFFGEDSKAVKFIDDKVRKSPNGLNETVLSDENQMMDFLWELGRRR